MVKDWKVGYHWVKNLCEMLLHDRPILDQNRLTDILIRCEIKTDVTVDQLEEVGWVFKLNKDKYLLNGNFYGKLKHLHKKDNEALKLQLNQTGSESGSTEMQEFIFFGEPGTFKGIADYVNFGEDFEKGLDSKLSEYGKSMLTGIQSGKLVSESLFNEDSSFGHIKTSINIIFDNIFVLLCDSVVKEISEMIKLANENPIRTFIEKFFSISTQYQKKLLVLNAHAGAEESSMFLKRNNIISEYKINVEGEIKVAKMKSQTLIGSFTR